MTALDIPIPQLLTELARTVNEATSQFELVTGSPHLEVVTEQHARELFTRNNTPNNRIAIIYGLRGGTTVAANNRIQPQIQFVEFSIVGGIDGNVRVAERRFIEALLDESRVLGFTQPNSDYNQATQLFSIRRTISLSVN